MTRRRPSVWSGPARAALCCAAALLAPACRAGSDVHSALDPAGPQAGRIISLWWVFFWVCAAVYTLVIAAVVLGVVRARRRGRTAKGPDLKPDAAQESRLTAAVAGAVGLSAAVLFALLFASFFTGRGVYSLAGEQDPLVVRVVGHQWWWEVRYEDAVPSRIVTTANEIHIPTGRPVAFRLESRDVIHSFWVPNLHGKRDLIPGHPTETWLRADREGTFEGQCAEFCGLQHAKMRLTVVAEPPAQFDAWLDAQRRTPSPPATDSERRGQQLFLTGTCVMCHTVQGTEARANVGPNLTHVASSRTIAAGSLPNTRENLARWITDSQAIKPGTQMPQNTLSAEDLEALLDYLQSLK